MAAVVRWEGCGSRGGESVKVQLHCSASLKLWKAPPAPSRQQAAGSTHLQAALHDVQQLLGAEGRRGGGGGGGGAGKGVALAGCLVNLVSKLCGQASGTAGRGYECASTTLACAAKASAASSGGSTAPPLRRRMAHPRRRPRARRPRAAAGGPAPRRTPRSTAPGRARGHPGWTAGRP